MSKKQEKIILILIKKSLYLKKMSDKTLQYRVKLSLKRGKGFITQMNITTFLRILASFLLLLLVALRFGNINKTIQICVKIFLNILEDLILLLMEYECNKFIKYNSCLRLIDGKQRFVRCGNNPSSYGTILGAIKINRPRIIDRETNEEIDYLFGFKPKYSRIQEELKLECFLLYISGMSAKDIESIMILKYGNCLNGFSVRNINNFFNEFTKEGDKLIKEIFNNQIDKQYFALYIDATYINSRDKKKLCYLAVVGILKNGQHEIIDITQAETGTESTRTYRECFRHIIERGLQPPEIIIADGADAIWEAATECFPGSKQQVCFVHKCRNVFNAIPRKLWKKVGKKLTDITSAPTREIAENLLDNLINIDFRGSKKVRAILLNNRDKLLTFYDYPIEKRSQIYTSNPVETVFSLVKPRWKKTRGMMKSNNLMFIFQVISLTYGNDKLIIDILVELSGLHFRFDKDYYDDIEKCLEDKSREGDDVFKDYGQWIDDKIVFLLKSKKYGTTSLMDLIGIVFEYLGKKSKGCKSLTLDKAKKLVEFCRKKK